MTKNIATISKFLLIFVIITAWIFSGWPRIWQEPPFPPKIQEASASEATKTYAFATDSEGWTGNDGSDTTDSYQSGAGNPAGSIQSRVYGRNKSNATAGWYISGITWENLGVPVGATVNNVDGKYDWKCSEYNVGDPTSASGNLTVTDSADGNSTTLETGVTFSGTTAWATRNAAGAVGMPVALQPSNTSIKIKLLGNLKNANNAAAAVTRQMDTIVLIITYTAAPSITLTVDSSTKSLGNVTPGTPVTATTIATVTTDNSTGYSLKISDSVAGSDSALLHTDTTTRIADYAGTIASPTFWSGTGLGICVYAADTSKEAKWGTGTTETDPNNKYAGIPQTATEIHNVGSAVTNNNTSIGYKLNVASNQKTGAYSGVVTYTAVAN